MMYLANTDQIRMADQQMIEGRGFPGILLMEAAGRKSAEYILTHFPEYSHYLILCGPGNNGGDGLVIARYLKWAGKSVEILLSHPAENYQGDAKANWEALQPFEVPSSNWDAAKPPIIPQNTLLVDALLGTGIASGLRGAPAEIIAYFRPMGLPCVAVDLPSGLSADTGKMLNEPIPALATITFQVPKICHFTTPASVPCGKIVVADIGITPAVMANLGIRRKLITPDQLTTLSRPKDGHKGTFGHTLLVGGSTEMPGSIAMSAQAALHAGAGLSTSAIPAGAAFGFWNQCMPEIMAKPYGSAETHQLDGEAAAWLTDHLKGKNAIAIGPGLGQSQGTRAFLSTYFPIHPASIPLVLDADALNLLAEKDADWNILPPNTIITPHPGEMMRLAGNEEVKTNRMEVAEAFAKEKNVIVILKGQGTIIAFPDGNTWVNPTGNPGMGTAGSGDVLTGTLAGLLAQGYSPEQAAISGVYVHGLAGDLAAAQFGQAGVTATRISSFLGKAMEMVLKGEAPQITQI